MTRSAPRARDCTDLCLSAWPSACRPPTSAQVPHGEPAVTDDAVPADEVVADKEPAVEDNDAPADGAAADKEKKEKQHAEIVAKRHKAALAKKKRDEKREAKAAAAREEETDEEAEPAAEPAQVEPEAGEANETVAMEADESGEADASSMGYEAVMPHEEARVIVSMLHTRPPHPAHMLRI